MITNGCVTKHFAFVIFCLALWSCRPGAGQSTEEWCESRDNIEKATLVPAMKSLPDIGGFNHMLINGDTLVIHDILSQDKLFAVYDLKSDKYLGSFGRYGNGPGEMANLGGPYLDGKGGLVVSNGNQMVLQGVEIKKALQDENYKAFVKTKLDMTNGFMPTMSTYYINDTTVLCSIYTPGRWNYESHVGILNPETGVGVVIDSITSGEVGRGSIAVSPENNLIVGVGSTHDRIRFFDMDGHLKKTIYGPDYVEKNERVLSYFSHPQIVDDNIFVLYRGNVDDNKYSSYSANVMIVMDLKGKYIKTLQFDYPLVDIAYHKKSKRLYVSTDGEPQFGYLQLD